MRRSASVYNCQRNERVSDLKVNKKIGMKEKTFENRKVGVELWRKRLSKENHVGTEDG